MTEPTDIDYPPAAHHLLSSAAAANCWLVEPLAAQARLRFLILAPLSSGYIGDVMIPTHLIVAEAWVCSFVAEHQR